MTYTQAQVEYALGVVLDNAGDCDKARKVLDERFSAGEVEFTLGAVELAKWKNTEHSALYRRLDSQVRQQHLATVIARTQDSVAKASQGLELAVEKAIKDVDRTSGRDVAMVADKLSQIVTRGNQQIIAMTEQGTDDHARIIEDAMGAIRRLVDEGVLAVAEPIAEAAAA